MHNIKLETIVEFQFKQQSRAQVFFHINTFCIYLLKCFQFMDEGACLYKLEILIL